MIKLQDTGLIKGLPPGIAEQHWVKVLDAVFRERQKRELEAVRKVFVYTAIDSAPENILDILAVQFKVDWYRDDYPIDTKRRVIKTAMEVRRYCGTEWAVRQAVSAIYPNSEIVEWYDYNGTPGHWRLRVNITENADIAYYTIKRMESLLGYAKRCTAHLERILYTAAPKEKANAYIAAAPSGTFLSRHRKSAWKDKASERDRYSICRSRPGWNPNRNNDHSQKNGGKAR